MAETFALLGAAVLIVALAVPLVKRKVKQNIWYGYRVSIYVFKDEEIWYRVNEAGGKHMILVGAWLALCALVARIAGEGAVDVVYPIMSIGLILGLIASIVYTVVLAHRLAREKGLKKQ